MEILQSLHCGDEIFLRRVCAYFVCQRVEWNQHFGKAFFEDCEQKLNTALEVYVDGAFGAGNGFGDGAGGGGAEAALLQQSFCGSDDMVLAVSRGRGRAFWGHNFYCKRSEHRACLGL